jgi:predicted dehydrogenase
MINVGVIGSGYWGPNLIRNFVSCPDTNLIWACDIDECQLKKVLAPYPNVRGTLDYNEILADNSVDAVAIATPVHSHFPIGKACLENGKHVLIEKPLASTISEGEELVKLSKEKDLKLMCDHTYCYTGTVRKIKEIIQSGTLGHLLYYDSVRINLGLFQQDINVVWDLAPHDLSIIDFLIDEDPVQVSVHGASHAGNGIENIAYLTLQYQDSFMSHFHLNWLSPLKIRMTIICGTEKMLVWNDLEPSEKIKIYDKGVEVKPCERDKREQLFISYRSGDMYSPGIEHTEALSLVVKEFAECIKDSRPAMTDGRSGLRILRILENADRSIKAEGANVRINNHEDRSNGILLYHSRRKAG